MTYGTEARDPVWERGVHAAPEDENVRGLGEPSEDDDEFEDDDLDEMDEDDDDADGR